MTTATPTPSAPRSLTGTLIGTVVSAKRHKTRTVAVDYVHVHAKYGKSLRRQTKYHVHDETDTAKLGDKVEIAQCRPMSKTKSWRLVKVVQAAPTPITPIAEVAGVETPAGQG